jgi:hypothetical protein
VGALVAGGSVDRERASHLADLLEARGVSVWIDRKSIAGGSSWSAEIVDGIKGCAVPPVLVTPSAVQSRNVQQEVQLAWEHERKLLPVLLERSQLPSPVEYALVGRQWVEVLDHSEAIWLPQALRALQGLGIQVQEPTLAAEDAASLAPNPSVASLASAVDAAPRHNLPAQMASFIGRGRELAEVKERLTATRLVTLTGTGGCGKTRLALQVAGGLLDSYADGVWLIELAPMSDPGLVPDAVAAALRWFIESREAEEGLRLIDRLVGFWSLRGHISEERGWSTQLLELPGAATAGTTRATVLAWAGMWAYVQGEVAACRRLLTESLAMAQELADDRVFAWVMHVASAFGGPEKEKWYHATAWQLIDGALSHYRAAGDRWGIAHSLSTKGHQAYFRGDIEQSRFLLTECLEVAQTVGDRRIIAIALEFLGEATSAESGAEAGASLNESLRLYRELGDLAGVASVENLLGRLDCLNGRYASGREHYRASLGLTRDWVWMQRITGPLDGLAVMAAGQDQPEWALRLAAASARWREEAATEPSSIEQAELDRALVSVREVLGQAAAAAAWAVGQTMTLEEAIAYALKEDDA